MSIPIKVCGFTREADIDVAVSHGASYLGFIFYPPSKRNLSAERWGELAEHVDGRLPKVGVFVNADDHWLEEIHKTHPLDFVQLHGTESPQRAAEITHLLGGIGLIKVLSVSEEADLAPLQDYVDVASMLLFDAKPPKMAGAIPGGNGLSFDWRILAGKQFGLPWMLSGGISASNLATAIKLTGAPMLDLSSGVEDAPGIKNHGKLREVLALAKTLGTS